MLPATDETSTFGYSKTGDWYCESKLGILGRPLTIALLHPSGIERGTDGLGADMLVYGVLMLEEGVATGWKLKNDACPWLEPAVPFAIWVPPPNPMSKVSASAGEDCCDRAWAIGDSLVTRSLADPD